MLCAIDSPAAVTSSPVPAAGDIEFILAELRKVLSPDIEVCFVSMDI